MNIKEVVEGVLTFHSEHIAPAFEVHVFQVHNINLLK